MDLTDPRLDGQKERKTGAVAEGGAVPMHDIVVSSRPTEMTPGYYVDDDGLLRNQLYDRPAKTTGPAQTVPCIAVAAAPTAIVPANARGQIFGAFNNDVAPRILYIDNGTAGELIYSQTIGAGTWQGPFFSLFVHGPARAYWDVAPPAGSYVSYQPYDGR